MQEVLVHDDPLRSSAGRIVYPWPVRTQRRLARVKQSGREWRRRSARVISRKLSGSNDSEHESLRGAIHRLRGLLSLVIALWCSLLWCPPWWFGPFPKARHLPRSFPSEDATQTSPVEHPWCRESISNQSAKDGWNSGRLLPQRQEEALDVHAYRSSL